MLNLIKPGIALLAASLILNAGLSCTPRSGEKRGCGVTRVSGGALINCSDGSSQLIPDGANGSSGESGLPGKNGHNAVFTVIPMASSCIEGGITVLLGLDADDDGVLTSSDEDLQSGQICNGSDGEDSPPTPFSPVGLVDPCGDSPSVHDEVFLKLSNGTLLASFSDNVEGKNTRFVTLSPGTYQTSDGDNCIFTVNVLGEITYENHRY